MAEYPRNLPVSSLTTLMTIVKENEILRRKEEFMPACWNVRGFLEGVLVGIPGDVQPISQIEAADAMVELEKALRWAIYVSKAGPDWPLVVDSVQSVLTLLDRCRE